MIKPSKTRGVPGHAPAWIFSAPKIETFSQRKLDHFLLKNYKQAHKLSMTKPSKTRGVPGHAPAWIFSALKIETTRLFERKLYNFLLKRCITKLSRTRGVPWQAEARIVSASKIETRLCQRKLDHFLLKIEDAKTTAAPQQALLTFPTDEKNSSKSLARILADSCMQNTVRASLSSGVISGSPPLAAGSNVLHIVIYIHYMSVGFCFTA